MNTIKSNLMKNITNHNITTQQKYRNNNRNVGRERSAKKIFLPPCLRYTQMCWYLRVKAPALLLRPHKLHGDYIIHLPIIGFRIE